jgi:hypothetical protein
MSRSRSRCRLIAGPRASARGDPPRPGHRWQVVIFTVSREHIFRPCPGGTDIAAPRCVADRVAPDLDDAERRFFLGQLWSSGRVGFERRDNVGQVTQDFGYPFTGMGWTYNWDPGAPVRNPRATTPGQFCAGPAAPPA